MQRCLSILFITLLALSQYARQLDYLQCRFASSFSNITQHCDCEQQNNSDQHSDKEFPLTQTNTHHSIDEFYTSMKQDGSHSEPVDLLTSSLYYSATACKGKPGRQFKPPRSKISIPQYL